MWGCGGSNRLVVKGVGSEMCGLDIVAEMMSLECWCDEV